MSINSDTSPTQTNTAGSEVEGLRRLVEEQRKLIEKLSKQLAAQKTRIDNCHPSSRNYRRSNREIVTK
jgi:uncharacterized coiled-coil protein SlyX